MKLSIRKKILIFTIILSLVLMITSIVVSSIIFQGSTQKSSMKLCETSSERMSDELEENSLEFILDYKAKLYEIYKYNHEDMLTHSYDSYEDRMNYFTELTQSIFPPKTGFGLSYDKVVFSNTYKEIIESLELIASSEEMIGGYVFFYDEEFDNLVYMFDSTSENSPSYLFPGSIVPASENILESVIKTNAPTSIQYDKEIFAGYSPVVSNGETVAYVSFYYSVDRLVASQNQFITTLIVIMAVSNVLIIALYLLLADKFLVKNVKLLSKSVNEFTDQLNKDEELNPINPDVNSKDEIGELSNNFYLLQSKLVEYLKDLGEKTTAEQQMHTELSIASRIQLESLPSKSLDNNRFCISSFIRPAKEVGGDLFDYFMIDENKLFFVIADVSGKGVPAALFMMRGKEIIKSCAQKGMSIDDIASTVNNELCENNKEGLFITAFIGIYNIEQNRLDYVRCGHEQPFLLRDGKAFNISEESNFILGGFKNFKFLSDSIDLLPGDRLVLYTDGLNEGINVSNEEFGYERIKDIIEKSNGNVMDELYNELIKFSGEAEQFDDVTMLTLDISKTLSISLDSPTYDDITNVTDKVNVLLENINQEKRAEIDIIIDELMNNYISYAFENVGTPHLDIELDLMPETITLSFVDNGMLFNPLELKETEIEEDPSKREIGGLGVMIVKTYSDKIEYSAIDNMNHLIIKKSII